MADYSHVPVLKRDLYLAGRYARTDNINKPPHGLKHSDLDWWHLGWQERDAELNPARCVTQEEAAKIVKARAQAATRAGKQKAAVRRKLEDFAEDRAMRMAHAEVWE